MIPDLKFRIRRDDIFGQELWLRMFARATNGDIILPEPITFKVHKPDVGMAMATQADVILTPTSAQQLMDELWHVGLRPSEGTGSAGSLAATQRHLHDMRALVAKALSTELPK
jgi:hypothetical protein